MKIVPLSKCACILNFKTFRRKSILFYIPVGSVDEDSTLIIIEEGFSRPVKDKDFEPQFITPAVDMDIARMINETCGDNIECAFDIAVTGIVEVGRTTLVDIVEHMAIVNESLPSK